MPATEYLAFHELELSDLPSVCPFDHGEVMAALIVTPSLASRGMAALVSSLRRCPSSGRPCGNGNHTGPAFPSPRHGV